MDSCEPSNRRAVIAATVKIVESPENGDSCLETCGRTGSQPVDANQREELRDDAQERLHDCLLLDPTATRKDSTVMELAKSFAAGSISASFSSVLLQPLDLVKTRLQLGRATGAGVERGLVTHMTHIARTETLRGLWRGTAATIVRSVPGVGLYFSTLHSLKMATGCTKPSAGEAMVLGFVSRSIAGAALLPATVIKTRVESGLYQYRSMGQAATLIYTREGLRGLYSGLGPTIARDAPYSGLYLLFYTSLKDVVYGHILLPNAEFSDVTNFTCGVLAGLSASFVTHPADVLKTRMQSDPAKFPTVRHALVVITSKEGVQGLFSGLTPRLLRRTLMSAFAWTFYERLTQRLLQ